MATSIEAGALVEDERVVGSCDTMTPGLATRMQLQSGPNASYWQAVFQRYNPRPFATDNFPITAGRRRRIASDLMPGVRRLTPAEAREVLEEFKRQQAATERRVMMASIPGWDRLK